MKTTTIAATSSISIPFTKRLTAFTLKSKGRQALQSTTPALTFSSFRDLKRANTQSSSKRSIRLDDSTKARVRNKSHFLTAYKKAGQTTPFTAVITISQSTTSRACPKNGKPQFTLKTAAHITANGRIRTSLSSSTRSLPLWR